MLNPLHVSGVFLYPLKTTENLFFVFSGGTERNHLHDMRQVVFLNLRSTLLVDISASLIIVFKQRDYYNLENSYCCKLRPQLLINYHCQLKW